MSIDSKEFDKHKNPLKYILDFLRRNSDRGFTAEFIAKQIGLDASEISNALMWETMAYVLDRTYRRQIETATVKGVKYYKYTSA